VLYLYQTVFWNDAFVKLLQDEGSSVGVVYVTCWSVRTSIPGRDKRFFSSLDAPTGQGRINLFGAPRQWKHFRPLFQAVFLSGGGVFPPPRQSNTTPPSPKTEITNILFYILNFASVITFKM